jgi:hypothetical protein
VDGGRDFRTKRTKNLVSLANSSAMTLSFRDFYVWSKALTTNTLQRKGTRKNESEVNELSKIEHLIGKQRCNM